MNLKEIREDLHRIPEVAFSLFKTQKYLLDIISKYDNLEVHTFDFTGIVIYYNHGGDSPYKLFRADMDALPIQENTGCSFQSEHHGVMHACGHDTHMTILLGLLDRVITNNVKQNIIFVFQPGEEGHGGALKIIQSGIFEGKDIKECYALHTSGDMPVGTVTCKSGIIFGIPQEFDVEFKGVSTHIATPQHGKDALMAGFQFYSAMKQIIPQSFDPVDTVLFQIGRAEAGVVRNAIPASCLFEGTHRSLSLKNSTRMNEIMTRVATNIAAAHELEVEVRTLGSFDAVINDDTLYNKFKETVNSSKYTFEECNYKMTGEDFGFFTTFYNGLLFWLGSGDMEHDLHSDKFLPKPESVEVGVDIMWLLLNT